MGFLQKALGALEDVTELLDGIPILGDLPIVDDILKVAKTVTGALSAGADMLGTEDAAVLNDKIAAARAKAKAHETETFKALDDAATRE